MSKSRVNLFYNKYPPLNSLRIQVGAWYIDLGRHSVSFFQKKGTVTTPVCLPTCLRPNDSTRENKGLEGCLCFF